MPGRRHGILERRAAKRHAGSRLAREYKLNYSKLSKKAGKNFFRHGRSVSAMRVFSIGDLLYRFALEKGLNAAGIDPRNNQDKPLRDFAHRTIRKSLANMQFRPRPDVLDAEILKRIDRANSERLSDSVLVNIKAVLRVIQAQKGDKAAEKFFKGFKMGLAEGTPDYDRIGLKESLQGILDAFKKKPKKGGHP